MSSSHPLEEGWWSYNNSICSENTRKSERQLVVGWPRTSNVSCSRNYVDLEISTECWCRFILTLLLREVRTGQEKFTSPRHFRIFFECKFSVDDLHFKFHLNWNIQIEFSMWKWEKRKCSHIDTCKFWKEKVRALLYSQHLEWKHFWLFTCTHTSCNTCWNYLRSESKVGKSNLWSACGFISISIDLLLSGSCYFTFFSSPLEIFIYHTHVVQAEKLQHQAPAVSSCFQSVIFTHRSWWVLSVAKVSKANNESSVERDEKNSIFVIVISRLRGLGRSFSLLLLREFHLLVGCSHFLSLSPELSTRRCWM